MGTEAIELLTQIRDGIQELVELVKSRQPASTATVAEGEPAWPDHLGVIRDHLLKIDAPTEFFDVRYWKRIDAWVGNRSDVFILDALDAYLAWWECQSGSKRHKDLKRGFRNWLSTNARWAERESQRRAIRNGVPTR